MIGRPALCFGRTGNGQRTTDHGPRGDQCALADASLKALFWGLVLCLSIARGRALVCLLVHDRWRHRRAIDQGTSGPVTFPGSTLEPGRVQLSLYGGEVAFRELRLMQRINDAPFRGAARFPG